MLSNISDKYDLNHPSNCHRISMQSVDYLDFIQV
jgi:hypothetical protein